MTAGAARKGRAAGGCATGLLNHDPGAAHLSLNHGKQHGGVGWVQPDATVRGSAAEPVDVDCAMDGEIVAVEDRIGHRRAAIEVRAVIAIKRLWSVSAAWRAADAGRNGPCIEMAAVNGDRHA